jgi:hypothetical protein
VIFLFVYIIINGFTTLLNVLLQIFISFGCLIVCYMLNLEALLAQRSVMQCPKQKSQLL